MSWIAISRFCDLWELGDLRSKLDELNQLGALTLTLTLTMVDPKNYEYEMVSKGLYWFKE